MHFGVCSHRVPQVHTTHLPSRCGSGKAIASHPILTFDKRTTGVTSWILKVAHGLGGTELDATWQAEFRARHHICNERNLERDDGRAILAIKPERHPADMY